MNILDALNEISKQDAPDGDRIMCEDGLLSVSDEVFECKMRELGFDKEDIDEWLLEPAAMRHVYINQWKSGKWKV